MSTDIKLSKAQISKIIQSAGFLGSFLSKLTGPLMTLAITLGKIVLAPLGIIAVGSGNTKGKGVVRAGTGKQSEFNATSFF